MTSTFKTQLRRLVPRGLRSNLRSPKRLLDWLSSSIRFSLLGPRRYKMREDWSILTHPYAFMNSFKVHVWDDEGIKELDHFISYCSGDMVFFDAGAHFGVFTLAAMRYGGERTRAYAFDPSPMAERYLLLNARLNGYADRVIVRRVAIGESNKTEHFVSHGLFGAGYFSVSDQKTHDKNERKAIVCRSLDSLVEETGVLPTHVKIDVEGFEWEALRGGRKLFTENSPFLFLELHNQFLQRRSIDPEKVLNLLDDYGYNRLSSLGRPLSKQDTGRHPIVRLVCEKSTTLSPVVV